MATAFLTPVLDRVTEFERVSADVSEVRARALALPPRYRMLLQLYWAGRSQRELAALMGMSPGSVHRMIGRLKGRLHRPMVVTLFKHGKRLPVPYRQVGLDRHMAGLAIEEIAERNRITRRQAERILTYLEGWASQIAAGV